MSTLLCFGLGYSATALAERVAERGWTVIGTSTSEAGADRIAMKGYRAYRYDGSALGHDLAEALGEATHVIVSAPPNAAGDPVLSRCAELLGACPRLAWIGYLSTIGVYGDHQGQWVDEETPPHPQSERSRHRLAAEFDWLRFGAQHQKRVQIFRLAGIYGPGRSAIDNVRDGSARPIDKPGQVFNRIHVEDIAQILDAAIMRGGTKPVYNVTDDEPAPPQDVIAYAAKFLGMTAPRAVPFAEADLSPMARSFYAENKRVRNRLIKDDLGIALKYPTFREGLAAISGKSP